ADRGVGVGSRLDQVEILLARDVQRLGQGLDPQLGSVGVDQSDLPGPDPLVHPVLGGVVCSSYRASLLWLGRSAPALDGNRRMRKGRRREVRLPLWQPRNLVRLAGIVVFHPCVPVGAGSPRFPYELWD